MEQFTADDSYCWCSIRGDRHAVSKIVHISAVQIMPMMVVMVKMVVMVVMMKMAVMWETTWILIILPAS